MTPDLLYAFTYFLFNLLKLHALNQRSPAEGKGKGQKLLAQGSALGNILFECSSQ